jgi:hypothetical protein
MTPDEEDDADPDHYVNPVHSDAKPTIDGSDEGDKSNVIADQPDQGDELAEGGLELWGAFHNQGTRTTLERLQRYANTYDSGFYRNLHEPQRLQAVRRGRKIPAPVALDVTVNDSGSD